MRFRQSPRFLSQIRIGAQNANRITIRIMNLEFGIENGIVNRIGI